jgi:hypothetical protein
MDYVLFWSLCIIANMQVLLPTSYTGEVSKPLPELLVILHSFLSLGLQAMFLHKISPQKMLCMLVYATYPVHLHLLDLITVYQYLLNHRSHHKVGHLPHYFSISKSVSLGFKSVPNTWASHTHKQTCKHTHVITLDFSLFHLWKIQSVWKICEILVQCFSFPLTLSPVKLSSH